MATKEDIQLETIKLQEKQIEIQTQNNKMIQQLIEKGLPIADKYFNKKLEKIEAPKIRWSILGFISILALVIVGTGYLVYVEKLDPANFTFLLGIIIGASVTFLGDILFTEE